MNLAILSRNKGLHSIRRLLKEAKSQRVNCAIVDPLDCQIVVGGDTPGLYFNEKLLPHFDVVLPRIGTSITEYGLSVVKQFECLGTKVINSSQAIAQSRDKLRCLQILAQKKIDVPTTVFMRGRGLRLGFRQVHGAPAIIKVLRGTQGVGVMLVESMASAQSVLETLWNLDQDVLLQQYISESAGRDLRAFVIGDKVIAAMRRQAREGEFRSNIHRGGEGEWVELPAAYNRVAVQSAKILGLGIAGVDMLETLSGPKIIEVNSSPGFEGIEKATGLNIAKMIMQYIKKVGHGRAARRRTRSK